MIQVGDSVFINERNFLNRSVNDLEFIYWESFIAIGSALSQFPGERKFAMRFKAVNNPGMIVMYVEDFKEIDSINYQERKRYIKIC